MRGRAVCLGLRRFPAAWNESDWVSFPSTHSPLFFKKWAFHCLQGIFNQTKYKTNLKEIELSDKSISLKGKWWIQAVPSSSGSRIISLINMEMQRNVDKPERRVTVPVPPFSHPKIQKAQNALLGNLINRKMEGREGKERRNFPRWVISLRTVQDMAKHRVYTGLAFGIQMQRHVQFILLFLLLVSLLQHKLLWLDGEISTVPGPLCTETIQSLCVTSKPSASRKKEACEWSPGLQLSPLHSLSHTPSCTKERSSSYPAAWAVG